MDGPTRLVSSLYRAVTPKIWLRHSATSQPTISHPTPLEQPFLSAWSVRHLFAGFYAPALLAEPPSTSSTPDYCVPGPAHARSAATQPRQALWLTTAGFWFKDQPLGGTAFAGPLLAEPPNSIWVATRLPVFSPRAPTMPWGTLPSNPLGSP